MCAGSSDGLPSSLQPRPGALRINKGITGCSSSGKATDNNSVITRNCIVNFLKYSTIQRVENFFSHENTELLASPQLFPDSKTQKDLSCRHEIARNCLVSLFRKDETDQTIIINQIL